MSTNRTLSERIVEAAYSGSDPEELEALSNLPSDIGDIVISVNGQSGPEVTLTIPETPGDIGAATAAQGSLADSAVQPGDLPTFGTAASADVNDFATAAQGSTADSAVQPGDLAAVATSGSYADLTNTPTLGTAAAADTGDFATAAQGNTADSAVQPGDLATVATSGAYNDLTGTPQGVAVPDATDDAIETVNALLASLRTAGLIAS